MPLAATGTDGNSSSPFLPSCSHPHQREFMMFPFKVFQVKGNESTPSTCKNIVLHLRR